MIYFMSTAGAIPQVLFKDAENAGRSSVCGFPRRDRRYRDRPSQGFSGPTTNWDWIRSSRHYWPGIEGTGRYRWGLPIGSCL